MGLVLTLLVVGLALIIVGIAVPGILWLMVIGLVLFVASILVAAVRGPDAA